MNMRVKHRKDILFCIRVAICQTMPYSEYILTIHNHNPTTLTFQYLQLHPVQVRQAEFIISRT